MNEVSEPIVKNIPESDNILKDIRSTIKKYPSGYPTNKEFNVEIQEISFDDMVQLLYLVAEESNTEIGNIQQCTYTNTDDSVSIVFKILDINIDIVFHLTYDVIEKLPALLYEYLNKGTLYNELKSCINKPSLLLQIKAGKKVLTYYGAKDIQKDPDFEDFIEYIKEHSPYHIDNHHSWLYSESDVRPNISSIAFSLKKTIKYNNSKEIIVNFPGKDREYIKGLTEHTKAMLLQ